MAVTSTTPTIATTLGGGCPASSTVSTQESKTTQLAKRNINDFTPPSLDKFDWDIVLSPENFPRTLEDGHKLVGKAADQLTNGVNQIIERPPAQQTFDNTFMAYHDLMTKFDAVERLIRSERLIDDKTPGKQDLLNKCTQIKNEVFSSSKLIKTFLDFTQKNDWATLLTQTYAQGIFHSIDKSHLSPELKQSLEKAKQQYTCNRVCRTRTGDCPSKVLTGGKREISFLTSNLCIMPEANSMIYGGLLPWRARIDAIADKFKMLDPDILFLQEVYDVHALDALRDRLGSKYYHFLGNITPRICGLSHESLYPSSGLAVISKFQLDNVNFEPYKYITREDKPSGFDRLKVFGFDRNYGIFHCDVMNGQEKLAHFATTHENPFFADIREKQTQQIVESFQKETASNPKIPAILCGDLNIERGDMNEGGERLIKEHFIDLCKKEGPTWYDFGNHWARKWHGDNAEKFLNPKPLPWMVDRSLLWQPWAAHNPGYRMEVDRVNMHDNVNPETALTDHHAVLTRFSY